MELEEAIQWLNDFTNIIAIDGKYTIIEERLIYFQEAIETVLQENQKLKQDNYILDKENQELFEININSIPKKKIEDKINKLDLEIDEEYEKSMAYHQLVYARCELKELLEDK